MKTVTTSFIAVFSLFVLAIGMAGLPSFAALAQTAPATAAAPAATTPAVTPAVPEATAPSSGDDDDTADDAGPKSPADKMRARMPQPVRVGDLIGRLVYSDAETLGYVTQVVRTPDGHIRLVVPFRPWLSWFRFDYGTRLVAVPIEVVASVGLTINSLDMDRDAWRKAATWTPGTDRPLAADEIIQIALARE